MTTTSYIDTPEPKLANVEQANFVDHWVDLTVEEEVSRGLKIRDLKSLRPKDDDKYLKAVKDNFYARPFNPDSKYREKPASAPRRRSATTRPISPTRSIPLPRKPSHASTPSLRTSKVRKLSKCPLRIAELAAPTKRHCLATFKSTAHQLPDFMVERLKFHIMDRGPIIKVHDAVECFKRHKVAESSCKSKKSKNSSTSSKKDLKNSKKLLELRNMCLMFGGRIARKLSYPMELTLLPELQKLSDIVNHEIGTLFNSHKIPILFYDAINNEKIQSEVSNKVAVWITTILEEVSVRMMEEDLRAKSKAKTDGLFKTLIEDEQFTLHDSPSAPEFEEEQGPALDALDDALNNALDICDPAVPESESGNSELLNYQESKTFIQQNEDVDLDETLKDDWLENAEETDPEENVENGTTIHNEEEENNMFTVEDYTANTDQTNDDLIEIEPIDINELDEPVVNEQGVAAHEDQTNDDVIEIEPIEMNELEELDMNLFNKQGVIADETNQFNSDGHENVSDVLEDIDDKKKVAFISTDNVRGNSVDSDSRINIEMFIERLNNPPKPITYPKPDVNLSIPNDHLLCDADESWPEESGAALNKSISSVVKSVTSLGMIFEKTAKNHDLQAEEEISMTEEYEAKISKELANTILDAEKTNDEQIFDDQNTNLYPLVHDMFTSGSTTTTVADVSQVVNSDANASVVDDFGINLPDIKEENYVSSDKTKEINERGKGDFNDLDSEKNLIFEAIRQKLSRVAKEARFDYKVYPNSAPPWALRHTSSDETVLEVKSYRNKMTQNELRKWCRDLNRIVVNLEQWNIWIESTCKQMFFLRQNAEALKLFAPNKTYTEAKNWSRLKKNVDKDAVLWKKLYHRTSEALKTYNFTSTGKKPKQRTGVESSTPSEDMRNPEAILEMLDNFDRQCLLLHRVIVSTEYCAKCDCKNFSKEKVKPKKVSCLRLPKFGNQN